MKLKVTDLMALYTGTVPCNDYCVDVNCFVYHTPKITDNFNCLP